LNDTALRFKCFRQQERPFRGPFLLLSFFTLFLTIIFLIPGRMAAMEVHSLKNGLNYIFEERKNTGVVAIQVWVNVGSKDEDDRVAGITHFIEHLIFKGTEKLKGNAFASQIEAMGGSVNAFTSFDNTVYHIIIPSHVFREGFELLMESVRNPAFPDDEITKERKVVLEEIKMGEDDPQRKLFKELFSLSYHGEAYGRPVIGFADVIEKVSRQDIIDYFRSHYVPSNQTIVITGDFDSALARGLIAEQFSGDPSVTPPPERHVVSGGGPKGDRQKVLERELREKYTALAYPIPRRTSSDVPAIEVLGVILGDGESSRLQEVLKSRKGVVNGIATYVFTPKEEGLFVVYANYSGDRQKVLQGIDGEIRKIQKNSIKDWELTKAKNMLRAYYVYDAETAQGRARQIGDSKTMTGDPYFIEKYLRDVDRVTADDVRRMAVKYLQPNDRRTVTMGPRSAVKNPYRTTLDNGLTCLVNKNASSPTFSFRVGFIGGLKAEQPSRNGEFNILARMLLKGTKKKTSSQIAREIDTLAGALSPYNGRNLFGLSGRFLSKDIKEVLKLVKELLMETSMTDQELARVKREVLSEIRQRDDDPVSFTFLRFNETIFADHPYGRDPLGGEKDVEALSLEDVKGIHRQFITPHGAVFAFSGDIDENDLFPFFEDLFGGWEGKKVELRKMYPKPLSKDLVVEKDIQQTHMVFGFIGPGLIDKDRPAAEVLDAVLSGMGGRIHKVLREENPYAYAVTFFNQMAYETGAMGIYIGTSEAFAQDVNRIARGEIEKIREKGFSEKEVQDGKNYLIGNHYIRMQSNGSIASSMCFDTLYGLEPGTFKVWPSLIERVTKEDVDRVARKYLTPDSMVRLVVGKVKEKD